MVHCDKAERDRSYAADQDVMALASVSSVLQEELINVVTEGILSDAKGLSLHQLTAETEEDDSSGASLMHMFRIRTVNTASTNEHYSLSSRISSEEEAMRYSESAASRAEPLLAVYRVRLTNYVRISSCRWCAQEEGRAPQMDANPHKRSFRASGNEVPEEVDSHAVTGVCAPLESELFDKIRRQFQVTPTTLEEAFNYSSGDCSVMMPWF